MDSSHKIPETAVPLLEAIKAERLDLRMYRVNLRDDYCIGSVPNGGYTGACMLAAAADYLSSRDQRDTLTVHFEYPSRTSAGPAIVTIDDVKLGQAMSTLHLTLWQGDLLTQEPWLNPSISRRIVLAYSKHVNIRTFEGISLPTGFEDSLGAESVPVPNFHALRTQGKDDNWAEQKTPMVATAARSLCRWHLYTPRADPLVPGVLTIWMRLSSGEHVSQSALPYVVDSYPFNLHAYLTTPELRKMFLPRPPGKGNESGKDGYITEKEAAEQRAAFWFPTLVLDFEAKTPLPEDGAEWLSMRVTSKQIKDGKFDLEILIRDVDGEFVALAHQVAMIVSMERNTAKRTENRAVL